MIRAIISFLASVLTAIQVFLLHKGKNGLCFNDGCAVVDSLTNISPLFFNIAGFLFFQTLFWLFLSGRNGSEYWHKLARLLLQAGLAAEAVLIFFQYAIATVFCSYCLVVFSIIVLLNLCCGLRQLVRGLVVFLAVMATCFSLQFGAASAGRGGLDAGSMGMVRGQKNGGTLYLFFSASCRHCEKVIESIAADNICTVRFNPIEQIENFSFPDATHFKSYDTRINRILLQSLSINEVPLLLAKNEEDLAILKGENGIREYLDKNCRKKSDNTFNGISRSGSAVYNFLQGGQKSEENACTVDTDCETDAAQPIQK